MSKRKAVSQPTRSSKRLKTTSHCSLEETRSSIVKRPLQQSTSTTEDCASWLPPSPRSTTRKRQRSEGDVDTCISRLVKHVRKTEPSPARTPEQDRIWDTIDDWVAQQLTPERIAALRDNPALLEQISSTAEVRWMTMERSQSASSTGSYSQGVRDGELPRAHSHKHESNMRKHGMFMGTQSSATLNEKSRALCKNLLDSRCALPSWFPHRRIFLDTLETFRERSESSIVKAITRYVLASPEALQIEGFMDYQHITESNDVLWTKCATLHGTAPKPDTAIGIRESAFDELEMRKLEYHSTVETPTRFTEEMFFPFLICEVKSIAADFQESERQAMHGASIAARAIIELFKRTQADGLVKQLDGEILVFSISQNHDTVKIFGHFPRFNGTQITFHRHRLLEVYLSADDTGDEWTRPYQFCIALCKQFFPLHLKRIRDSLSRHKEPSMESFTARLDLDCSQDAADTSQENSVSKRPKRPSSSSQLRDNSLRGQLSALTEELRAQRQESRQQLEQQRQESRQQLEQQRQEFRQQEAELKVQLSEQQAKIIELLEKR